MSADNWAHCPKCLAAENAAYNRRVHVVQQSYGKVSPEEFISSMERVKVRPEPELTLREDYDIGTHSDGTFAVSYSCSCQSCGFKFEFKEERNTQP